ncbi:MAG: Uma2 family endonuclease [Cyanobacteria bacterium P01_G01_bin.54]
MSPSRLNLINAYDDGSDKLYELFNGELIEVPPESGLNVGIANFLLALFLTRVGHLRVRGHGLELEVHGEPKNRYPDLIIIRPEHLQLEAFQRRNTIRLTMPPPLFVVEVVSLGSVQHDRDYIANRRSLAIWRLRSPNCEALKRRIRRGFHPSQLILLPSLPLFHPLSRLWLRLPSALLGWQD